MNLLSSSSLLPLSLTGSYRPVSRFTRVTGFVSNSSPTFTRLSKFSLVATSTEANSPSNESSCLKQPIFLVRKKKKK